MSSPEFNRDAVTAAILRATADLAAGRAAYGAAIATRTGLAGTDVEVLRLLAVEGAMTVGRIGELAALTTGATTRLVDRLEQAGFVRRAADPADRRRVMVELAAERAATVVDAWDPLDHAALAALDAIDDRGLAAVAAYLDACVDAVRLGTGDGSGPGAEVRPRTGVAGAGPEEASRAATAGGSAASPPIAAVAAPVASATAGRLVFVTGAPAVTIGGDPALGAELYRARFTGAVPSARVRDGIVTIRYPRFAWFDWRTRIGDQWMNASAHWRRDATDLVLNATLPWSVELRGGATSLAADLRPVALAAVELSGGADNVTLTLGTPVGIVPVRLKGGFGDVLVNRPAGTPVALTVRGGYRSATLDGTAAWNPGRIASAGAESAPDRFDIEISGGANRVAVGVG